VAFDMPYPPDYGGAIDIFFKVKALNDRGVRVILHVFLYDGKKASVELEKLCERVYYYSRKRFKNPFTGEIPYIVASRTDELLLANLSKDRYPVLFEGLHTTAFLGDNGLQGRLLMVRTHNVEHDYYRALEQAESSFFKKYFFRIEAERLEKYETVLDKATHILAISPADTDYFSGKYGRVEYIPAFHSNTAMQCETGYGQFVLYHGNLGIGENNRAALYLVHEVFPKLKLPCVVAGNNPSRQLVTAVKSNPGVRLLSNISSDEILQLVQDAHVNVLVTFQTTGIKLKLLNSLFRGRHCVVNKEMVENTGLEEVCEMGQTSEELVRAIEQCAEKPFTEAELAKRREILDASFSNLNSAGKILSLMQENRLYT
jgi:hypothetical protein